MPKSYEIGIKVEDKCDPKISIQINKNKRIRCVYECDIIFLFEHVTFIYY